MSTRPQNKPHLVITNASMGTSLTSDPSIISNLSKLSYQVVWTAGSTPVGTVSVQVSNDYYLNADGTPGNPATASWDTVALNYNGSVVTTVPITGNSGHGTIDVESLSSYAVRLIYTRASGTGTMNVTYVAKVA